VPGRGGRRLGQPPQAECPIGTGRSNAVAGGMKGNIVDRPFVSGEAQTVCSAGRIPQLDPAVLAGGCQQRRLGIERQGSYRACLSFKLERSRFFAGTIREPHNAAGRAGRQ